MPVNEQQKYPQQPQRPDDYAGLNDPEIIAYLKRVDPPVKKS